MKVKELIEELQKLSPESEIIAKSYTEYFHKLTVKENGGYPYIYLDDSVEYGRNYI